MRPKPANPVFQPGHALARGLVGAWLFPEGGGTTVRNHGGSRNNTGSFVGTVAWDKGPQGPVVNFPGGENYINCGDWTGIDGATSATFVVRLRRSVINNTGYKIAGKLFGTGNRTFQLSLNTTTASEITFDVWSGSNRYLIHSTDAGLSSTTTWYNVVFVWRGGNDGDMYVNGRLTGKTVGTANNPTALTNSSTNLNIGRIENNPTTCFVGDIDSLIIYRNRALTAREIITLDRDIYQVFRSVRHFWPVTFETITSSTFTADAIIQSSTSNSFTADAFILEANTYTFSANAILQKAASQTFTADAAISQPVYTGTITWQDNAQNESGFSIERGTDGINFAEIDTVAPGITQYTDPTAIAGTEYYYRLRAFNDDGYSDPSGIINVIQPSGLLGNLTAYWPLDETSGIREDVHGPNNLTDNNTVLSTPGVIDNAADFVAANTEYLSCVDDPSIRSGNINFTWTGWFKFNLTSAYIISKGHPTNSTPYEFRLLASSSGISAVFSRASGANASIGAALTLSSGVWYFFAFYHDADNNQIGARINDGAISTIGMDTLGVTATTQDFYIAKDRTTYLTGSVDEVARWDKVLSATEMDFLYNSGAGRGYTAL